MCPTANRIPGFGSHECMWILSETLEPVFHCVVMWHLIGEETDDQEMNFPLQSCSRGKHRSTCVKAKHCHCFCLSYVSNHLVIEYGGMFSTKHFALTFISFLCFHIMIEHWNSCFICYLEPFLFNGTKSCLMNNGYFLLERGTRQWCPICACLALGH